jgi:hypothetical protein
VRGGADLKRKTYVDRLRRPNLTDQLFGNGLDVADQQIAVDLFEWGSSGNGTSTNTVPCMTSCRRRRLEARRDW